MNYLEIIGTLIGLLYLYWEYKASIYLWLAGVIMPAVYVFVYYDAALYADMGINIYYCMTAAYGWIVWKTGDRKKQGEMPVTHTPLKMVWSLFTIFVVLFVGIALLLTYYTNSDVPWWDSFTTALSVVALWMLAHKQAEQWLAWVLVDAVSSGLYLYKELYFTAGLYLLYTVIALFGYWKWIQMIEKNETVSFD